jgi:hypothetical protein
MPRNLVFLLNQSLSMQKSHTHSIHLHSGKCKIGVAAILKQFIQTYSEVIASHLELQDDVGKCSQFTSCSVACWIEASQTLTTDPDVWFIFCNSILRSVVCNIQHVTEIYMQLSLTLCRSYLKRYCTGRKTAFFSLGI